MVRPSYCFLTSQVRPPQKPKTVWQSCMNLSLLLAGLRARCDGQDSNHKLVGPASSLMWSGCDTLWRTGALLVYCNLGNYGVTARRLSEWYRNSLVRLQIFGASPNRSITKPVYLSQRIHSRIVATTNCQRAPIIYKKNLSVILIIIVNRWILLWTFNY